MNTFIHTVFVRLIKQVNDCIFKKILFNLWFDFIAFEEEQPDGFHRQYNWYHDR